MMREDRSSPSRSLIVFIIIKYFYSYFYILFLLWECTKHFLCQFKLLYKINGLHLCALSHNTKTG